MYLHYIHNYLIYSKIEKSIITNEHPKRQNRMLLFHGLEWYL
jgi:hypothetical protein